MKYCTANCLGKGFFVSSDRHAGHLSGHPGNVWCVADNNSAWIERVGGTEKTLEEAQAFVDGVVANAQAVWDSGSEEYKTFHNRPIAVSLPV
jgi:hypothetical protein